MKKTWIKIKRGLLAPKHRNKLGIRIWLYMYILDQADWETGKIFEWRDKEAAEDLQMPWRTLQQQRQQLDEDGYISCVQSGNKQIITINNWTNPREYSGEIYNNAKGGTQSSVHPKPKGTNEGTNEGTNKGVRKPSTPSYRSHITDHRSEEEGAGTAFHDIDAIKILSDSSGLVSYPNDQTGWIDFVIRLAEEYGVEATTEAMRRACSSWVNSRSQNGRPYRKTNLNWINWAQEILAGGELPSTQVKKLTAAEKIELERQRILAEQE